jgi:GC-rich sequence DNA-binding factor
MNDMIVDLQEDEEDEDAAEWAQEQARRGGQFADGPVSRAAAKKTYKPSTSKLLGLLVDNTDYLPIVPPLTPIPTLGPAVARLAGSLTALTTSHSTNTVSLSSVSQEHTTIDGRETELRTMIDKAEAKRSWFEAFREWVESVATFLDEKV